MHRFSSLLSRSLTLFAVAGLLTLWTTPTSGLAQSEVPDDPLAELTALGDAMAAIGPEGGGSIRAKADVDPKVRARKRDKRNFDGRVDSIKVGSFPAVAVRVRVSRPAKDGPGKGLQRNALVVLVPVYKVEGGAVAMQDEATRLNAGAFYLKAGDRVVVRLGENIKDNLWQAEYIERK